MFVKIKTMKELLTGFVTEIKAAIQGERVSEGKYKAQVEGLREDLAESNAEVKKLTLEMETETKKGVSAVTESTKNENIELKVENAKLNAQNEILNGAFKEMGIDVKSMKEIMDKLVDGLVAGSKVNILNSKNTE